MKTNKNKKVFRSTFAVLATVSVIATGTSLPVGAKSVASEAADRATRNAQRAFAAAMGDVPDSGEYNVTYTLLDTRDDKGKVYMFDEISFEVENGKVVRDSVEVEQNSDNLWYFEVGTKIYKVNKDGSLKIASTYEGTVDMFSAALTYAIAKDDCPIGLTYSKTYYYTLYNDGTVELTGQSKGKVKLS